MRYRQIASCGFLLTVASLCLFVSPTPIRAELLPSLTFTHSVASGDVRAFSAVLWTRVDREARLKVEVSTDRAFQKRVFRRTVVASADNDFTAKIVAFPLEPDQSYFYRWIHDSSQSEIGTFRTPPLRFASAEVRFAFSGDSDGRKDDDGLPRFNEFEVLDRAREEDLDFFVYLGDTIYGRHETLAEFRDAYKENREFEALRNLLKATSTYAIWDDHEVENDFAGETVDPMLFANGRKAFLEYMPIGRLNFSDPACAGAPLFRVFHWGEDVDIIILDERSCRSANVEPACRFDPDDPDTVDLVPTLPTELRQQFARQEIPIPPEPPTGCLEALFDPSRTMLGHRQKALFKLALLFSRAKFKFVINEVPIQQFYATPYDRWEGYAAERAEILNFIRANHIENVIFLTTDLHANLINEVFLDRFLDPEPIADEFVTGPIAHNTIEANLEDDPVLLVAFNTLLDLVDVDCRHLDAFSYGVVNVDSRAGGTTTITLKDDEGMVLLDQKDSVVPCTKTIGDPIRSP